MLTTEKQIDIGILVVLVAWFAFDIWKWIQVQKWENDKQLSAV